MGTGGSNPAAGMGKAISNLIASVKGQTYKSKMLDKMTFGDYNKKRKRKLRLIGSQGMNRLFKTT